MASSIQEQIENLDKKMAQTDNERLNTLREKQAQLKAREQALLNRINEKERKARMRRLFKYGELAEKYLDCEGMEPEDFETVLRELIKGRDQAKPTRNTLDPSYYRYYRFFLSKRKL